MTVEDKSLGSKGVVFGISVYLGPGPGSLGPKTKTLVLQSRQVGL